MTKDHKTQASAAWKQYALTLEAHRNLLAHMDNLKKANHLPSEQLSNEEEYLRKEIEIQRSSLIALGENFR